MQKRRNITIDDLSWERLLQWGEQNHVSGGASGAIKALIWQAKVRNGEVRGQQSFDFGDVAKKPKQ